MTFVLFVAGFKVVARIEESFRIANNAFGFWHTHCSTQVAMNYALFPVLVLLVVLLLGGIALIVDAAVRVFGRR